MLKNNTDSSKYLSLKTAAESYGYTRDHLGLMIRRGKLQGIKIGNYYVTTNDWMVEYVKNFTDFSHPTSKNKLSNRLLTEILTAKKRIADSSISKISTIKSFDKSENKNQSLKLPFRTNPKNSFEERMSEELSKLSSSSGYDADSGRKFANFKNYEFKVNFEHPYIVLPIREMSADERDNILNRIGDKKDAE